MSGRTQFIVGSVMLALAIGLIMGTLIVPRTATAQEGGALGHGGEGRSGRFALVSGIRGNAPSTETVYILDDSNEILFALEYSSRAHKFEIRDVADLRRYAADLNKLRGKREEKGGK